MRTRKSLRSIASIAAAVIIAEPVSAQEREGGMESVSFIVGCWVQPAPEGSGLREIYPPPAENMLTGLSQFWQDGRIVDFEFHRIDGSADGPLLTPHPKGVASVTFRPVEIREDRITWQNLDHDFPQRIIYHRVAVDTLLVRIEGGEGAGARSMEWRMARARCMW